MSQKNNKPKPITYDDLDMIPNITPKSILQHLPYKKFMKPLRATIIHINIYVQIYNVSICYNTQNVE